MTDLAADAAAAPSGVIAADDERYNAALVSRVDQHDSLGYFWVRFDAEPTPFEPGQYMTIGVFVDERIVQRPYSVASPPRSAGTTGYEFYLRLVQGGTFTPILWHLPVSICLLVAAPLLAPFGLDRFKRIVVTNAGRIVGTAGALAGLAGYHGDPYRRPGTW